MCEKVGKMGTSGKRDCQWVSKNSSSNSITLGYDRMEQIRRGGIGDGIEGNFWEEGLPPCIQSQLECLCGWSVHNLLWELVPLRDYANAERMLTAAGFTPLLVNLESMSVKPSAVGGNKN